MPNLIPFFPVEMLLATDYVLDVLGHYCISHNDQEDVVKALMWYIEVGPGEASRTRATSALSKMMACQPVKELITSQKLPGKLVRNLAHVMAKGTVVEACHGMTVLVSHLEAAPDAHLDQLVGVAASGGFVPGVLRLVREDPLSPVLPGASPSLEDLLNTSLGLIAAHCDEPALLQAIKLGLLKKVELLFRKPPTLDLALYVLMGLLRFPMATEKVLKAKLVPDLLVDAADTIVHKALEAWKFAAWLSNVSKSKPYLVVEALEAGVLEKLKQARDKAKRQVKVRLNLSQLITSFDALLTLGDAELAAYASNNSRESARKVRHSSSLRFPCDVGHGDVCAVAVAMCSFELSHCCVMRI